MIPVKSCSILVSEYRDNTVHFFSEAATRPEINNGQWKDLNKVEFAKKNELTDRVATTPPVKIKAPDKKVALVKKGKHINVF